MSYTIPQRRRPPGMDQLTERKPRRISIAAWERGTRAYLQMMDRAARREAGEPWSDADRLSPGRPPA